MFVSGVSTEKVFNSNRVQASAWFDGSSDEQTQTPALGDRTEWIMSVWLLHTPSTNDDYFFSADTGNRAWMGFDTSNRLYIQNPPNSGGNRRRITSRQFFDTGWYHIVVSWDSDNATADDRIHIYVNGELIGPGSSSFDTFDTIALGTEGKFNKDIVHRLGLASFNWDGYMAQSVFLDGVSIQQGDYAITDFGNFETVGVNGSIWSAALDTSLEAIAQSVGGNSWALTDEIGDGVDASGNSNSFTPVSMTHSDNGSNNTPSNNYPVLNKNDHDGGAPNVLNGGLTYNDAAIIRATLPTENSGKWYFRVQWDTVASGRVGIKEANEEHLATDDNLGDAAKEYGIQNDGVVRNNNSNAVSTGISWSTNDYINVAIDLDNNKLWFGQNGTWYNSGDPAAGTGETIAITNGRYCAAVDMNSGTVTFDFESTTDMPSGFKLINSANMTAPDFQGADFFGQVQYTGSGGAQSITGLGIQPDKLMCKAVNGGSQLAFNYDAIRGVANYVSLSQGTAEQNVATGLTSFDTDGFTFGASSSTPNDSGKTYWSGGWIANGAGVANTDGSIASTVSVSPAGNFSIVTFTGTGALGTVGHGLPGTPELIMFKNRSTGDNWTGQETLIHGGLRYLTPDTDAASIANSAFFNNTDADASVFTVNTQARANGSGNNMVAYCFRSVPGVCKVGTYEGYGLATGPYIFLGFEPALVMVKNIDTTARGWTQIDRLGDPFNQAENYWYWNSTSNRTTASNIKMHLLGPAFKLSGTSSVTNQSNNSFIFVAMANVAGGGKYPPGVGL